VDSDIEGFPMVHIVGHSSPRRPLVIDMRRGDPAHPKVTLVGKGVCYDTGGLDLKPHSAMEFMKKDMGGAAHVLGLAVLIMKSGLPVNLRVIIPAVENSVSGNAFRLGDVFPSRKGLTVENGNTDAEGRLILADCLTLASEDEPELIIDFATLTGSARVGLGFDIPAFFSNRSETLDELKETAMAVSDPLWPLPLWAPYRKDIEGTVADLCNVGKARGDAIHAALFLQEFLTGAPEWIHLDIYAWEEKGRPGRPKGGAETGLLAVYRFLQSRYLKAS
jgi:leucyl aminopeptidase